RSRRDLALGKQQIEDPAARRVGDRRQQLLFVEPSLSHRTLLADARRRARVTCQPLEWPSAYFDFSASAQSIVSNPLSTTRRRVPPARGSRMNSTSIVLSARAGEPSGWTQRNAKRRGGSNASTCSW